MSLSSWMTGLEDNLVDVTKLTIVGSSRNLSDLLIVSILS